MSFCTTSSVELAADEALDREQGVLRIGHRLALGRLADHDFIVLGERDDRRRGAVALAVLDHARLAAFHDRDAGIGRSQVDADDLRHVRYLRKIISPRGLDCFRAIWEPACSQLQVRLLRRLFATITTSRPEQASVELVAPLHHLQYGWRFGGSGVCIILSPRAAADRRRSPTGSHDPQRQFLPAPLSSSFSVASWPAASLATSALASIDPGHFPGCRPTGSNSCNEFFQREAICLLHITRGALADVVQCRQRRGPHRSRMRRCCALGHGLLSSACRLRLQTALASSGSMAPHALPGSAGSIWGSTSFNLRKIRVVGLISISHLLHVSQGLETGPEWGLTPGIQGRAQKLGREIHHRNHPLIGHARGADDTNHTHRTVIRPGRAPSPRCSRPGSGTRIPGR